MSLRDQHGPFFGEFGGRYMPESLIAAIYLDGGLEAARGFILRNWEGRAARAEGARRFKR